MSFSAPITVPVELSPVGDGPVQDRVFRLARTISVERLSLDGGLAADPEWLQGPLRIVFHLPEDPAAVICAGRAVEVVVDEGSEAERAEQRAIVFTALPPEAAERIGRYIEARQELR